MAAQEVIGGRRRLVPYRGAVRGQVQVERAAVLLLAGRAHGEFLGRLRLDGLKPVEGARRAILRATVRVAGLAPALALERR